MGVTNRKAVSRAVPRHPRITCVLFKIVWRKTITHFCKELLSWQGLCRCVRTELTAVCHCGLCSPVLFWFRTQGLGLLSCGSVRSQASSLGCADTQFRCLGWIGFFVCVFSPSLRRWLKSVCVQRALWTRGHPAWQTLGCFASSAMVNDCAWTILTLIHASCTQRGCSQFWQQRFLKPGCTSAHISTADQIHALEVLWACPGHEATPFRWPG